MAESSIAITYVPADCGSIIPGKSKAPQAFRDVGIVDMLRSKGVSSVSEHHALESPATWSAATFTPGGARNEELNVSVCNDVHRTISQNLKDGSSPSTQPPFQLILGGECGMLPAIMTAYWEHADAQSTPKRVGLIYIDADTDLTSPTDPHFIGTFASATMTHLLGNPGTLLSMKRFSRPSGQPVCDASTTVFFGTNMDNPSNRTEHFAYLFDHNYKVISSSSVAKDPEGQALKALDYLKDRVDIIVVHLDVDSIDPCMFPLANVPNFTGVGFEEMMRALQVLLSSKNVGGLVVAEVNPDHDPKLEMVRRLTDSIVSMLVGTIR